MNYLNSTFRSTFIVFLGITLSVGNETAKSEDELPTFLLGGPSDIERDGSIALMPYLAPVFPSFSHPKVVLNKIDVRNLKWSEKHGIAGTLVASGHFQIPLAKTMGIALSEFHPVCKVYINGSESSVSVVDVPIKVPPDKNSGEGLYFDGKIPFSFERNNISFTEGLNTIRITVPDPFTAIEGGHTATATIATQELQEAESSLRDLPLVKLSKISYLAQETDGESFPFVLTAVSVKDPSIFEKEFTFGHGRDGTRYRFSTFGEDGVWCLAKQEEFLTFCFLPSHRKFDPDIAAQTAKKLSSSKSLEKFSQKSQFLMGYSIGVFLNGGDILTGDGEIVKDGIIFDPARDVPEILGEWIEKNGERTPFRMKLPHTYIAKHWDTAGDGELAGLLWETSELFRKKDAASNEVGLSFLTNDYAPLGINFSLSGWRSDFLANSAEYFESFGPELASRSTSVHGFYYGMFVGTGSQVSLPPLKKIGNHANPDWKQPLISDVLQHLRPVVEVEPPRRRQPPSTIATTEVQEQPSIGNQSPSEDGPPDTSEVSVPEFTVNVPEKYKNIWPFVSIFYRDIVWDDFASSYPELFPDSIKHPFITPILFLIGILGYFITSIWFLVNQFTVSLGWGFGQLAANAASCLLVIPGAIVGIIFCCLHWRKAKLPFLYGALSLALCFLALLFVPAWTQPVPV